MSSVTTVTMLYQSCLYVSFFFSSRRRHTRFKCDWSSVFFFSSRRRHTRFKCDWSSDVCSSDLASLFRRERCSGSSRRGHCLYSARACHRADDGGGSRSPGWPRHGDRRLQRKRLARPTESQAERSEERRVGEEGRSRWAPAPLKK